MPNHPLEEILHPRSIAVVGASANPSARGYSFTKPLLEYGFKGQVYPVNPKYPEILGLKSYPSVRDIPGPVDYVISCVPSGEVLKLIDDCAFKGVKAIHFFTARFSETGREDAAELERELLRRAKKAGIRIIGPNCMGVYYPAGGISFRDDFVHEPGAVAFSSQSGNVAREIIQKSPLRGIRFSKVISYGNAIDFNECDFLDYFSQDPETKVIMMYIEGVKDGKRFFNILRKAALAKPIIILKGGRGEAGARATASHTASLAGSMKAWEALIAQTGAISAESFDELIDIAIAFYFLPPITGRRAGVAGGAGGASVLAADQCEEAGLQVIPLPTEIREELKAQGNPMWDWLANPADISIAGDFGFNAGVIFQIMAKNKNFDLLIAIIPDPWDDNQKKMSVEKFLDVYKIELAKQKPYLAVASDRSLGIENWDNWSWKLVCETRTKLIEVKIPFYPSIGRAARAASKMISYYQKRE